MPLTPNFNRKDDGKAKLLQQNLAVQQSPKIIPQSSFVDNEKISSFAIQPGSSRNIPLINVESYRSYMVDSKVSPVRPSETDNVAAKQSPDTKKSKPKKHKCSQCRMCYVKKAYLIKHVLGQHGTQNSCLKCMQIFNTQKEHNDHMVTFHSRFICEICGAAFKNNFELKHHIDTHRDSRDNLFKCPFQNCTFSHNRYTYFEYHINKHRRKTPFCCGKCNKKFCSRYIFNRHVRTCIGDFGKCPKCEKEFHNDSMLYDHIQSCHLEKTFECPECNKTYKWRASLSRHLTLSH